MSDSICSISCALSVSEAIYVTAHINRVGDQPVVPRLGVKSDILTVKQDFSSHRPEYVPLFVFSIECTVYLKNNVGQGVIPVCVCVVLCLYLYLCGLGVWHRFIGGDWLQ